jgi:hypothetical protein
MRNYILLLLFSMVIIDASAEKLLFTNSSDEIDITGNVTIDRENGNVTVTTTSDLVILQSPPGFVSLFSESDYRYDENDNVSVKYTKAFVENCELSDNPTNQNSWVSLNSANGVDETTVLLDELPKTYTIRCDEAYGSGTIQKSITFVQDQPTQSGSAPTLTLSASPNSIVESGDTTLTWTVGNDATSCTASNGWTGNKAFSNGPHNQTLSISSTTTYALSCSNQFGTTNRQVTVTVTTDPVDPSCAGISMPPLLSQSPVQMTYTAANGGQPFGTSTGTNLIVDFNINQYLELSGFSTSEVNFYRKLQFYPTPSSSNATHVNVVSVSECPGDFTESATCLATVAGSGYSQMKITTNPNETGSDYCKIERNKSYYLNIIHDQYPFDTVQGRCAFTSNVTCAIFLNELSDSP